MQSMFIPLFSSFHQTIVTSSSTNQPNINDFIWEEELAVLDEQLQPQEHGRVRRQPTRNKQPSKYGIGGYIRH